MKNRILLLFVFMFHLAAAQKQLPAVLKDGRFYLKIPSVAGDTVLGFCDTGGGYTAIYEFVVKRLALENAVQSVSIDGEQTRYLPAKEVIRNEAIPLPEVNSYYKPHISESFFEVADDKEGTGFLKYVPHDAFLGQFFYIRHAWTFDYRKGQLWIHTPVTQSDSDIQVLGFKKDKSGNKRFGHPSMKITVDGKNIDVLFDTGASLLLSESGKTGLGTTQVSAGGSFIAQSIFDRWKKDHPDWKVIEKGELNGMDLIEVPEVQVGSLKAGPVWFAKRPDEAWSKGMIGSMDKVVKGAIGGSLLQYFTVTIDYQSELIRFKKD